MCTRQEPTTTQRWPHRTSNKLQTFSIGNDYEGSVNEHSVCQVLGHHGRVGVMELYKAHARRHRQGGVTARDRGSAQGQQASTPSNPKIPPAALRLLTPSCTWALVLLGAARELCHHSELHMSSAIAQSCTWALLCTINPWAATWMQIPPRLGGKLGWKKEKKWPIKLSQLSPVVSHSLL